MEKSFPVNHFSSILHNPPFHFFSLTSQTDVPLLVISNLVYVGVIKCLLQQPQQVSLIYFSLSDIHHCHNVSLCLSLMCVSYHYEYVIEFMILFFPVYIFCPLRFSKHHHCRIPHMIRGRSSFRITDLVSFISLSATAPTNTHLLLFSLDNKY